MSPIRIPLGAPIPEGYVLVGQDERGQWVVPESGEKTGTEGLQP